MTQSDVLAGTDRDTVHIGRQPVYLTGDRLYGYELLFRGSANASTSGLHPCDGDTATTRTILSAFAEFGTQDLLGDSFGFINLTRAFLIGQIPVPFAPDHAVLEILETVAIDDDVIRGARHLVDEGYQLALDDFVWSAAAHPLLELASVVKLDVLEPSWEEVEQGIDRVRGYGVRLLAERIEDGDMLARCQNAGFELFQGYFLGRPQVLSAESLTPGQALAVQLVARLGQPDASPGMVEDVLRTDPALTYRLLKIANSAANGLMRPVSTIRDAVVILGLAKLRAWLVLISMTGAASSPEALTGALALARTCESLARVTDRVSPDVAFTLGMLHGIGTTLGLDGGQLTRGLPTLGPELDAALHGERGPLRSILDAVLAYQQCQHDQVHDCGYDGATVGRAYLGALAWTHRTYRAAQ